MKERQKITGDTQNHETRHSANGVATHPEPQAGILASSHPRIAPQPISLLAPYHTRAARRPEGALAPSCRRYSTYMVASTPKLNGPQAYSTP